MTQKTQGSKYFAGGLAILCLTILLALHPDDNLRTQIGAIMSGICGALMAWTGIELKRLEKIRGLHS